MQYFLGIDVSKAKVDVALLLPNDKFRSKVFANDGVGFQALVHWLLVQVPDARTSMHICMESTGIYHEALACFISDQTFRVSVVNPLLIKRFAEASRLRNKTDGGDAKCIALFCKNHVPERWEAPTLALRALQALVARLETLQKMRQAEDNRLEAAHITVADSIKQVIRDLDLAIEQVKAQINSTIDDDPDLRSRAKLLQSIPGLGDKTIPPLLAYIGRPERFKTVKAISAYAALTPMIRQSGSSLNKNRGTHPLGHQELKRLLYFPAMVAGRYNPLIAAFWAKLKAQNKPGKVIVVACMHKLLAIAYGVLCSKKPFDPDHLKHESP
jgi:transposase